MDRRKVTILGRRKEQGKAREGGVGLWGGTLGELDAAVDAFIRFPELRMKLKSEYTLEMEIIRRSSCDPISVCSYFCTLLLTFSTSALHEITVLLMKENF